VLLALDADQHLIWYEICGDAWKCRWRPARSKRSYRWRS
jgi:hypothetical protein